MRIYLAGPMRGRPHFNFPAFDDLAAQLRGIGHEVFNPAEHDRQTYGADIADKANTGDEDDVVQSHGFDLRQALGADLAWITANADAVAVLDGWQDSRGARAEVATALALGLPVGYPRGFRNVIYDVEIRAGIFSQVRPGFAITSIDTSPPAEVQTPDGEVRAVSSTGGEKGVKPARMSLLPAYPLRVVAEHYGKGAAKYSAHNWRKGYEFSKSSDAMMRHAVDWIDGEDIDEDGYDNLAAVVFHALTLIQGMRDWPQFDDRYKPAGDAA